MSKVKFSMCANCMCRVVKNKRSSTGWMHRSTHGKPLVKCKDSPPITILHFDSKTGKFSSDDTKSEAMGADG